MELSIFFCFAFQFSQNIVLTELGKSYLKALYASSNPNSFSTFCKYVFYKMDYLAEKNLPIHDYCQLILITGRKYRVFLTQDNLQFFWNEFSELTNEEKEMLLQ